jgi:histidinol-phosphatase (PHP family)
MNNQQYVSVHGGHSGQFCHHAKDMLEDIILKYISLGYSWVGITEHTPAIHDNLLYPDQREAGFTPDSLLNGFAEYIDECRRLQKKYADKITVFTAIEIETYSGYDTFIPMLLERFQPDYMVGSVHFVNDMGFDYSLELYDKTAKSVGGYDNMYCQYFDLQYDMIKLLEPAVVGHFDLIRIFDPEYRLRLKKPEISKRVERNLELIKDLDLIMDYNLRSLLKGADEPYITDTILRMARDLDIRVVPGDDSHGVDNIHLNMKSAIETLASLGFDTDWPQPTIYSYSISRP